MLSSPRSRLRVAMLCDSPSPSGVGEHMLTLAQALNDRVQTTFVLSDATGARSLARQAAAAGHAVETLDGEQLRWWPSIVAARLRRHAPDIVHAHAGAGWEINRAAIVAEQVGALATVRTEHLPYLLKRRVLRREHAEALAQADRVIFVSDAVRGSHAAAGLSLEHATVVRNGIRPRPAARSRGEVRAALGVPEYAPLLLTVARFTAQKGHADLLAAAPAILGGRPDARLLWVGTGRLRPALMRQATAAGFGEAVLFAGARPDVPDLLAAADLFVLPSRFEGLPLALLEAMAAGLPVLGVRAPGTTEVLEDGGGALAPADPEGLAQAVLALLADPDDARRLGEQARVTVTTRFSAERMAEETLAVYQAALADSAARMRRTA